MDEYGWGLTSAGFRRPTYNELLDALEHKARELFGATANLTVRSPLGLFLRIFAWILNILFSVLEDVYNSRFVDTAVGTSLLNLGRAIGLRVLSAQKASGYIMVTGPPGVIVPAGWLVETAAGIQFFAVSDTEIGAEGTVMVPFRCTSTGPDGNVAADTITTITNPGSVAGITAVTNPAAFTGGRERETDEEFREEAKVFENDTDDVDDYGLPPHSIEAVVYGGLDSDIAQIIYKELGAGIQTTGQKVIEVITASGATKAIHFNRPHPVPVYVKVVGLSTSGDFPHDGVDQLRAAIVAYIGDNESGGVSIGETLYHQRLPAVLYKVPGVLDFDVLIGTDAENLQADNIPVDSRSKVVTDDGMVTIDA